MVICCLRNRHPCGCYGNWIKSKESLCSLLSAVVSSREVPGLLSYLIKLGRIVAVQGKTIKMASAISQMKKNGIDPMKTSSKLTSGSATDFTP